MAKVGRPKGSTKEPLNSELPEDKVSECEVENENKSMQKL